MNHLSDRIEHHIGGKWPMLCYLKPQSQHLVFWFSEGRKLQSSAQGLQFYIQSFNPERPAEIWSKSSFDCFDLDLIDLEDQYRAEQVESLGYYSSQESEVNQDSHQGLVSSGISAIRQGLMRKVVLSRTEDFPVQKVDWLRLIWRLIQVDQNAFRYLLLHPDMGLWCGATPEILISVAGGRFSTMALAGTRWPTQNKFPDWTHKEHEEHDWVVQEILQALEPFADLNQGPAYNHQAGSMEHLRTDISGTLSNKSSIIDLARSLHPTPAVCGFPKSSAFEFIQTHEGYDRMLYSGYLGLFNPEENQGDFYVNLRCMRYELSQFQLFVGGGITQESNVHNEWLETQRKMTTMGHVIAPFIEQR